MSTRTQRTKTGQTGETGHISENASVHVGVGGWTYEPWRDNFFPAGLPRNRELAYASRKLTAIEVNGTYYGTLKPASFKKWHDETPDGFIFSLKATRYATNRRHLAEAGESIKRFLGSGITELREKLGPIVWQFMPGKVFDPEDFEAFLALLPDQVDGHALRHVVDVRNETFMTPDFLALVRKYKVATVFADAERYPSFADLTADFAYARLMRADPAVPTGYEPAALDEWARRAGEWASGSAPADLPTLETSSVTGTGAGQPRDVFVYFINGAKERAPSAAMTLLEKLGLTPESAAEAERLVTAGGKKTG
ncbi:MAG: DUF72 domain-containing protein [Comamonadaceae bacterium]|nr:MAG: DUF72 domain-containing protein [Comamonadaceae bacterium]